MKKAVLFVMLLLCAPTVSASHDSITDPEVYIPLREEMTHMEIRFVELELLTASQPIDYAAIETSLKKMAASSKKIREVNRNEVLKESLKNLADQVTLLEKEIHGKDAKTIRKRLDRLYQNCFRCHETHAPRM